MPRPTFVKDQNGVVFSDMGCMSADAYREFSAECSLLPPYDGLPFWDSRQQSFIDVNDQVSGKSESEPGASPDVMGKGH